MGQPSERVGTHPLLPGASQQLCPRRLTLPALLPPPSLPARSSKKVEAPWTDEMEQQTVAYYCAHYIDTFSQADVSTALACIPQLNMWDGERCVGVP